MRKWLPLVAICLGAFMLLIDVSIVNVALPKMSADLHSSFTSLQWVVDMYALVLASLLLAVGSMGDRLGHRRMYVGGLVLFALASLACGLAPGVATLITARAVQGLGAAAMFTSTTSLLNATYHGRDRGTAFGIWGAVNGSAAAVGPILGGLLTEQFGWRSIFLVNLPVAVLGVFMALRVLKESKNPDAARLDYAGALAFTVFAAAATYALIESADKGWGSSTVVGLLIGSGVALLVFIVIELRVKSALLDLSLFRRPTFVGLMVCALLFPAAAFAHLTYTSIWLQSILGMSPIDAGLAVSPLALASFVVSAAGGRALHRLAPQLAIGGGLLCVGGGTLLLMLVSTGSTWTALVPGLLLCGVGVGMVSPVLTSAVLGSVPYQRAGMASGALNTFRQLGYALGIAVLGTVFADRLRSVGGAQAAGVVSGGGHGTLSAAGQQVVRHAAALSLDRIYLFAGCTALVGGCLVLALVRRSPAPDWAQAAAGGAGDQAPTGEPAAAGH
ncbi:MAG TPA: MFS transporter [Actinocrinis sp.]|nr:MFS transporter [Actinocrinis sp.]